MKPKAHAWARKSRSAFVRHGGRTQTMNVKRFLAAMAALLVLVAPAAFAATAATSGETQTPAAQTAQQSDQAKAKARAAAIARYRAIRYVAAQHNVTLARRLARLQGKHLSRNYARKAAVKPLSVLRRSNRR